MYKKIQYLLKRTLRSFLRDYRNFFSIISKHIEVLFSHPFYYCREYLNMFKSLFLTLILRKLDLKKIVRKVNGLTFEFDLLIDKYMLNTYFGVWQSEIINTLLKYLKKEGIFIDVGANIGYITVIAAGIVGKKGEVYSFEPIPRYFKRLQKVALTNKEFNINTYNFALGNTIGVAEINLPEVNNIGNNSMVPGLIKDQEIKEIVKINVRRLDDFILNENLKKISLIKIDVEGYEFEVLKGLTKFFEQEKENLPPIIVEITPRAYELMGYSLEELEIFMNKYSYHAYTSDGNNKIDLKKITKLMDILFLKK